MTDEKLIAFGQYITKLMAGEDLNYQQALECWTQVINNDQPEIAQGAFLAAMGAKTETEEEIAAAWKAICELDTNRVDLSHLDPVVENCGTGMDSLKTFNISTAAAVVAAAGGVFMARHGARALTSKCGTVDVAEQLGVDVECPVETVKTSIEKSGIGLFNGMSAGVHPKALFRILSQIRFGSTLNIAGSLASPALPNRAVRGVYSRDMLEKTARAMKQIGYQRAIVAFGYNGNGSAGIDELSTMGTTRITELMPGGSFDTYEIAPEDFGIERIPYEAIASENNAHDAAKRVLRAISPGGPKADVDIVCLNAGAIFYIADKADTLAQGVSLARSLIENSKALEKLKQWILNQNSDSQGGLKRLEALWKKQ